MDLPFGTERERLDWLLAEVRGFFKSQGPVRIESEGELEIFLVVGPLVRLAFSYGEGVSALLAAEQAESIAPIERSIYELWGDTKYLLTEDEPARNAIKLRLNAILEMDHARELVTEGEGGNPSWAGIDNYLESAQENHPKLLQEVRDQRNQGKYHWSGARSRVAVLQRTLGKEASFVYKKLSWESHAIVTALRDVEYPSGEKSPSVVFASKRDDFQLYEGSAYRVGGMLYNIWGEAANRFNLQKIELPVAGSE